MAGSGKHGNGTTDKSGCIFGCQEGCKGSKGLVSEKTFWRHALFRKSAQGHQISRLLAKHIPETSTRQDAELSQQLPPAKRRKHSSQQASPPRSRPPSVPSGTAASTASIPVRSGNFSDPCAAGGSAVSATRGPEQDDVAPMDIEMDDSREGLSGEARGTPGSQAAGLNIPAIPHPDVEDVPDEGDQPAKA
ncbi:hypothetical protein GLOTRDRAFT_131840 [Gloeophyllum trabeum ATCC 11539]|uniref:Uncharacterized protein n=1 Tax=Gloeophyllum trabeum (strain ATCC 11539 / FP-39264 / Madison 617) TaxID=670483 RepID=S7PY91_GLOTA|nr:uncharacterized protein GLOTRDRAFT_131840 [Gloeophyllum trabeum ATCC 11539]EPQ52606.1 hypothetical protein GLOTRDRAFT_131840 [Gloeophyllum trabeum ATCC 11539]